MRPPWIPATGLNRRSRNGRTPFVLSDCVQLVHPSAVRRQHDILLIERRGESGSWPASPQSDTTSMSPPRVIAPVVPVRRHAGRDDRGLGCNGDHPPVRSRPGDFARTGATRISAIEHQLASIRHPDGTPIEKLCQTSAASRCRAPRFPHQMSFSRLAGYRPRRAFVGGEAGMGVRQWRRLDRLLVPLTIGPASVRCACSDDTGA